VLHICCEPPTQELIGGRVIQAIRIMQLSLQRLCSFVR
jgi:hypothetical protein